MKIEDLSNLANKLEGSFGTPTELADIVDNLDLESTRILDTMVFCCARCEHWHRQYNNATPDGAQWICKECFKEER